MPAGDVLRRMESRHEGLAESEAHARMERFGPNRLRPAQRRGPLARFFLQFHNILIYVLLAAAGVTAILALKDPTHWLDTGVILGVVIINAIIGFMQEGKAERALEAISRMLSNEATVVRDGSKRAIPAEELTLGDVVMLRAGDKVAADLRLLESRELRIDEAMLTGESVPAEKLTEPVPAESGIGDRSNLGFSGTLVTSGQGLGVVVKIGDRTEIGRISELVAGTQEITTPLIAQMNHFGRVLTVVIVAASVQIGRAHV